MAIRSYGPGKFDTVVDSYVYNLTLDGCCECLGDAETFGYYCATELGKEGLKRIAEEAKENKDHLTLEEARLVRKSYGAITEEGSQGFVSVRYFDTKEAFDKKWAKIEAAYEKFCDENDEEDY